ncbi:MAG: family 10 glycosylhydrolase [Ruminococcus sp.]|nr:family 10 glycosylhydrolase [Ruminococcus sp.]
MKYKQITPILLVLAILISVVAVASRQVQNLNTKYNSKSTPDTANTYNGKQNTQNNEEMRGVWVSYMELSMENEEDKSQKHFTEKFEEIAENCKALGYNTLVVQVRPFCDALYKSDYFPWSHILTGEQGKNPNYDPLKIMCEICIKNDLKIHAWVNPYRISTQSTPKELSDDNPYVNDNSIGFETKGGTYLDPSNKKAKELIVAGIEEIVKNYDVDAVQFDDYFYPSDMGNEDEEQYKEYIKGCGNDSMTIEEWRKANVNLLISETYRHIHSIKDDVEFGISPQGNINNSKGLFADVKLWCTTKGYLDYICPQIYFSLENPSLTFEDSLQSWCELEFASNVELYVGLAGYKAGKNNDEGTWLEENDILSKEYKILCNNQKVSGFMMYSYASLNSSDAKIEMENLHNELK